MKLGEIKIEALKLMHVNIGNDIGLDNLESYGEDEVYRSYLVDMPGAINRCFASLEEKRVLPTRRRVLSRSEGEISRLWIRFDLSELVPELFDIDRLVKEDPMTGYDPDASYMTEGEVLLVPYYEETEGIEYTLLYKPRITRVTSATPDTEELEIPDAIAAYIPYFIKGDLYMDDEPGEAAEARNWYEAAMDEIFEKREQRQSRVYPKYAL